MIMPIRQNCPRCHTSFMGSDAIGGLCPICEGTSIIPLYNENTSDHSDSDDSSGGDQPDTSDAE